ncbi:MAG: hypothetical protein ACOC78_01945 [Actinomycetota bacterium]
MKEEQERAGEYVSLPDNHALREGGRRGNQASHRETAYYQAAMHNPASVQVAYAPSWMRKRSVTDIIILVLKHSFLMLMVMMGVSFLISIIIVGAAFGGSVSGVSVGYFMLIGAETLVLVWAGYRISAEAMERGKGWMYGAGCVAAIVFFWQPLLVFVLSLFFSSTVVVPVFDLVGIMVAVFLYLPMGALGGWIAERRYIGS